MKTGFLARSSTSAMLQMRVEETFPVTSENNQITSLFVCRFQDFFGRISYLYEDLWLRG